MVSLLSQKGCNLPPIRWERSTVVLPHEEEGEDVATGILVVVVLVVVAGMIIVGISTDLSLAFMVLVVVVVNGSTGRVR